MAYKKLEQKISQLADLVATWREGEGEAAQIELDLAITYTKNIYEMLRFPIEEDEVQESEVEDCACVNKVEAESQIEPEIEPEIEEEDEPDVVVEILFEDEDEDENEDEEGENDDIIEDQADEEVMLGDSVQEEETTQEEELCREEPQTEEAETQEEPLEKRLLRRRRIFSFYDEEESVQPAPESSASEEMIQTESEQEQEEPASEESLQEEPVRTPEISDHKEEDEDLQSQSSASQPRSKSLGSMLSFNDKYLLAHDLFAGNTEELAAALSQLDELETLDDVMLHIAVNYSWKGDTEGARLLNAMLRNRFKN